MNIQDDRGMTVKARRGAPGRAHAPIQPWHTWLRILGFAVAGAVVSMLAGLAMVFTVVSGSLGWVPSIVLYFLAALAGPATSATLGVFYGGRQKIARPVPSACNACGYRLNGLAPESDGCCVCPECGAAWRVALMHYQHVPAYPAEVKPSAPRPW